MFKSIAIFKENENPNDNHLPQYVVVELELYEGEIWDNEHPTHVPIFPVEKRCHYQCCSRKQIPLEICWAKTLHTFQGSEAGKKKKEKKKVEKKKTVSKKSKRVSKDKKAKVKK